MFKVVNLDHHNTLPGGVGQPYDRAIVMDMARVEKHPITGAEQPLVVYHGSLAGANDFVDSKCSNCREFMYWSNRFNMWICNDCDSPEY